MQLLTVIDQAYDHRSWHGPNLRGSLRGLPATQAAWRPAPKRHNIWETTVHCAYWKYAVWRRLTGEKRGSFPLKGSNWFVRPLDPGEGAWRADVALLDQMHSLMREAAASVPEAAVHRAIKKGSKTTIFELLAGIAAHDVYHAGQIQLLKRLSR